MQKKELAARLRKRQRRAAILTPKQIAAIPDDVIIENYNSCPTCGQRLLNDQQLETAIRMANGAVDFVDVSATISQHKH